MCVLSSMQLSVPKERECSQCVFSPTFLPIFRTMFHTIFSANLTTILHTPTAYMARSDATALFVLSLSLTAQNKRRELAIASSICPLGALLGKKAMYMCTRRLFAVRIHK